MKKGVSCLSLMRSGLLVSVFLTGGMAVSHAAHAISNQECHKQFTAAKDGKAKGQSFKEFKAANCVDKKTSSDENKGNVKKEADKGDKKADASTSKGSSTAATTAVDTGDAVFPTAIAEKYASEKEGNARMKTCLDQYNSNKASNKNGKLKWIQKGGGYYSECTKRLKEHKGS